MSGLIINICVGIEAIGNIFVQFARWLAEKAYMREVDRSYRSRNP